MNHPGTLEKVVEKGFHPSARWRYADVYELYVRFGNEYRWTVTKEGDFIGYFSSRKDAIRAIDQIIEQQVDNKQTCDLLDHELKWSDCARWFLCERCGVGITKEEMQTQVES